MTLQDLFNRLASGELGNLSIAKTGSIDPGSYTKITNYANEGLLKLYTQFVLKESEILLTLYDEITFYNLVPRFSTSYVPSGPSDDEPIRYIQDRFREPFADEVIKILEVYDNFGCKIPLNNMTEPSSVFTPQAKVLQVPQPMYYKALSLNYQRRHSLLTGALTGIITLPEILEEALTSYIAYKAFSHMNSDNGTQKSQEFFSMYNAICAEVLDRDLVNSTVTQTNTRFYQKGFI